MSITIAVGRERLEGERRVLSVGQTLEPELEIIEREAARLWA